MRPFIGKRLLAYGRCRTLAPRGRCSAHASVSRTEAHTPVLDELREARSAATPLLVVGLKQESRSDPDAEFSRNESHRSRSRHAPGQIGVGALGRSVAGFSTPFLAAAVSWRGSPAHTGHRTGLVGPTDWESHGPSRRTWPHKHVALARRRSTSGLAPRRGHRSRSTSGLATKLSWGEPTGPQPVMSATSCGRRRRAALPRLVFRGGARRS
jgi:hypothetical protein